MSHLIYIQNICYWCTWCTNMNSVKWTVMEEHITERTHEDSDKVCLLLNNVLSTLAATVWLDEYLQSLWLQNRQNTFVTGPRFVWKTPATRQTGQIHCKWKQKPGFSCDPIWSAAYHQIVCGATQRFHRKPHLLSIWPWSHAYTAIWRPGQCSRDSRILWNTYQEKKSGWGRNERCKGWDLCNGTWRKQSGKESSETVITHWFVLSVCCSSMNLCGDLFQMIYMISHCLPSLDYRTLGVLIRTE